LRERLETTSLPDWRGWLLSDAAKYLAQAGELESAISLARQACHDVVEWPNPDELRLRRRDLARLLVRAGRAEEALPLLANQSWPENPLQAAHEALASSEALLALGESGAARKR